MFFRQGTGDSRSGTVVLESLKLVGRHLEICQYLKNLLRVNGELEAEVLRLIVFVESTKPVPGADMHNAGNGPDLLPVITRKRENQRHFMPGHHPQLGLD